MILLYGEARGNGRAARCLYQDRFPQRPTPSHILFALITQRLRERGTFTASRNDPSTSIRAIARVMDVARSTVWNILHEQQLHAYHLQRVDSLLPVDFAPCVEFCTWFLHRCINEPLLPQRILFTDECTFTRVCVVLNSRNSHVWADENPHAAHVHGFQHRFSINVWAGILDDHVIGPYMLPSRLTGPIYLIFLQQVLGVLLDAVPLNVRQDMWFHMTAHHLTFHFIFGNIWTDDSKKDG